MKRDPLATLIKVRRKACDDAMRGVVAALEAEDRARAAVHAVERTIASEMLTAADPSSLDAAVESFARWLPGARRKLASAEIFLTERESDTAKKRAELTACKTALESVETLHKQRADAALKQREAALQRELDDRPRPRASELPP